MRRVSTLHILLAACTIGNAARCSCQQGTSVSSASETDPCAKYNSLTHRLNWASRKDKCLAERGCKFSGWRLAGRCERDINVPLEIVERKEPSNDISALHGGHVSPGVLKPVSEDSPDSWLQRLNKSASDAIAESLIESMKSLTPSITASAPGAVTSGVSRTPQATETIAKFVSASLQAPKVAENLHWNLIWLIQSQMIYDNAYYQAKYQRDYWFTDPEGLLYTRDNLVSFFDWYLTHPGTHSDVIMPMIDWALTEKQMVFLPAVAAINGALNSKETKKIVYQHIKNMLLSGMKSDYIRSAAKDELINVLREKAAAAVEDRETDVKRA